MRNTIPVLGIAQRCALGLALNVERCPLGRYSMAKVSPGDSLGRPEKISISRLLAGV